MYLWPSSKDSDRILQTQTAESETKVGFLGGYPLFRGSTIQYGAEQSVLYREVSLYNTLMY